MKQGAYESTIVATSPSSVRAAANFSIMARAGRAGGLGRAVCLFSSLSSHVSSCRCRWGCLSRTPIRLHRRRLMRPGAATPVSQTSMRMCTVATHPALPTPPSPHPPTRRYPLHCQRTRTDRDMKRRQLQCLAPLTPTSLARITVRVFEIEAWARCHGLSWRSSSSPRNLCAPSPHLHPTSRMHPFAADTIGMCAIDTGGRLVGGGSSNGATYKVRSAGCPGPVALAQTRTWFLAATAQVSGRASDISVVGAGVYADRDAGW